MSTAKTTPTDAILGSQVTEKMMLQMRVLDAASDGQSAAVLAAMNALANWLLSQEGFWIERAQDQLEQFDQIAETKEAYLKAVTDELEHH